MEHQSQENVASGSMAEVPNDPGKMFIGGLSWQTSPEETENSSKTERYQAEASINIGNQVKRLEGQAYLVKRAVDLILRPQTSATDGRIEIHDDHGDHKIFGIIDDQEGTNHEMLATLPNPAM